MDLEDTSRAGNPEAVQVILLLSKTMTWLGAVLLWSVDMIIWVLESLKLNLFHDVVSYSSNLGENIAVT